MHKARLGQYLFVSHPRRLKLNSDNQLAVNANKQFRIGRY